jgi:hypothetical protein
MPKRNYNQAKRQREASREQKKAEKLQRKLDRASAPPQDADAETEAPELPPSA